MKSNATESCNVRHITRTWKLRLKPTAIQKRKLQSLFAQSRQYHAKDVSWQEQQTGISILQKNIGVVLAYDLKDFVRMKIRVGHQMIEAQEIILRYEQPRLYYACISYLIVPPSAPAAVDQIIALDPGSKTFQSGFDSNNRWYEIGKEAGKALANMPSNTPLQRLKIKWRRRDMHCKLAAWLVRYYSDIMLPTLHIQHMVFSPTSNLNAVAKKQMLVLRHSQFRYFLRDKAEVVGARVHSVREDFTTQACGFCFHLFAEIGGNRVYRCCQCGFEFDRDFNSARLIFLSNLELTCGMALVRW